MYNFDAVSQRCTFGQMKDDLAKVEEGEEGSIEIGFNTDFFEELKGKLPIKVTDFFSFNQDWKQGLCSA